MSELMFAVVASAVAIGALAFFAGNFHPFFKLILVGMTMFNPVGE